LRADADALQPNPQSSEDWFFVHTVINYARAKQESQHLLNALALRGHVTTAQDLQVAMKRCFLRIEQDQIDALYEAVEEDYQP
jgi:hypothetical protein